MTACQTQLQPASPGQADTLKQLIACGTQEEGIAQTDLVCMRRFVYWED